MMLKGILIDCLTKWDPKYEFLHEFFDNFKPNMQGMHGASIIRHVTMHPCAKFEAIWTMLGDLMATSS